MELALIPPDDLLGYTNRTWYQLMLPQCLRSETYAQMYMQHCKNPDQYVILDNGAAEGEDWDMERLLIIASQYPVSEIVIPDVLGSYEGTLDRVEKSWQAIVRAGEPEMNYMAVVQGQSGKELVSFVENVVDKRWVTTLGLPRHLLKTAGRSNIRIRLADEIQAMFPGRFQIHFLGGSNEWAQEARHAALQLGDFVRSMDTSMPFVFAYHKVHVFTNGPVPQADRPVDYFKLPTAAFDLQLVQSNVRTLLEWTSGYDPS